MFTAVINFGSGWAERGGAQQENAIGVPVGVGSTGCLSSGCHLTQSPFQGFSHRRCAEPSKMPCAEMAACFLPPAPGEPRQGTSHEDNGKSYRNTARSGTHGSLWVPSNSGYFWFCGLTPPHTHVIHNVPRHTLHVWSSSLSSGFGSLGENQILIKHCYLHCFLMKQWGSNLLIHSKYWLLFWWESHYHSPFWDRSLSTMLLDVTPRRTHKGDMGFIPPLKSLILERKKNSSGSNKKVQPFGWLKKYCEFLRKLQVLKGAIRQRLSVFLVLIKELKLSVVLYELNKIL